MRNLILTFFACMTLVSVFGQARLGATISGGIITARPESFFVGNVSDFATHEVRFLRTSPTYSAGLTYQNKIGWTFMQASVLYNQYSVDYVIDAFPEAYRGTTFSSEDYKYIDLHAVAGIHANNFRIGVGPVFHILADFQSTLDIPNYKVRQNTWTAGFAGQIGYDLYPVSFDLKFENAFRTFGDHLYFNQAKTKLKGGPDQLTLQVTYTIGLDKY